MRVRQPIPLVLKPKEITTLQALLSQGTLPQRVAHRARILLARTRGCSVDQVTVKVDQDRTTVWRVCQRYLHSSLEAALYDAPRSGRPRVFLKPDPPTH